MYPIKRAGDTRFVPMKDEGLAQKVSGHHCQRRRKATTVVGRSRAWQRGASMFPRKVNFSDVLINAASFQFHIR